MKYIEELTSGSIFRCEDGTFVLSADFKKNNKDTKRMCINIDNGHIQWKYETDIVEYLDLYFRDDDGNILPLKEFKNEDFTKSHTVH